MTKNAEKALDDIYGGPPADFIKGRDVLAKELKGRGKDDEAARVKSLRKPSKAAAVLNALALSEPKEVKRYLGLADKLRKATAGKVNAERMRALAREEGELLEELVTEAGKLGEGGSAATLDRVRETLQAAQVDDQLRKRVLAGRGGREERAASVGLENLAAPPVAARRKAPGGKTKAAAPRSDELAREHRADAKARKRRADVKAELQAAEADAREAAREVAKAKSALAKAERTRAAADAKVERAQAKLERLS